MAEFGALLKQAREDRGVTLRQIATSTKISMVALEALERDDFSRLPGGIFSRAFVRAYALEVGLEPEQTVAAFVQEYDRALSMRAERVPRPEVTADDREFLARQHRAARTLRWVLIVLVVLAVAALVAWQVQTSWQVRPSPPPSTPAVEAAPTQAPPPPVATPGPSGQAETQAAGIATGGAGTAAAVPSPADAEMVVLHVGVSQDCWVRVRVDGVVAFAEVLHAGDERDVKPGRDVLLDVGNAGAVRWTVNGRNARSLGRFGQTGSAHLSKDTLGQYVQ